MSILITLLYKFIAGVILGILEKGRFPLAVDSRCRGLGTQPPAADKVLVLKV